MINLDKLKFALSKEIRLRRVYLNLTQADVANIANVAPSTVSHAEIAAVSVETMYKILNALNDYEDIQ